MNKKGFTLVELLAVIAILAILVIIAMPNVLEMFNKAKQDAFETEVKSHVKAVSNEFITSGQLIYSNVVEDAAKLPMDGKELDYYIELDSQGNIKKLNVTNGEYKITASGSSKNPIQVQEIGETIKSEVPESGNEFEMNKHGAVVEDEGETVVLKKVKIDNKDYNYEPGMTWGEWFDSEYNTLPGNLYTYRDVIWVEDLVDGYDNTLRGNAEFCLFEKGYMYTADEVYLNDEIQKGESYRFVSVGITGEQGVCDDGVAYYDVFDTVTYDMKKKVYHK